MRTASAEHVSAPGWKYLVLTLLIGGVLSLVSNIAYHDLYRFAAGDAADYSSMGRNLARGEGFTTAAIYPLQLSPKLSIGKGRVLDPRRVPNVTRPPLLPLIYALGFKIFGFHDSLMMGTSVFCYLILLLVVLFFADGESTRVFEKVLLLAVWPSLLLFTTSGRTEVPATLICVSIGFLIARKEDLRSVHLILLGILLGMAYLTRYFLLPMLPAALLLCFARNRGRRPLLKCSLVAAGWGIVAGPWLIRNYLLTGNPFFALQSYCVITEGINGYGYFEAHRGLEPINPLLFAVQHPSEIFKKAVKTLAKVLTDGLGVYTVPLLLGCFAAWRAGKAAIEKRYAIYYWLFINGLLIAVMAPVNLWPRYLLCTEIPLLMLAVDIPSLRTLKVLGRVGFINLIFMYAFVVNVYLFVRAPHTETYLEDVDLIRELVPENGLVLTDVDTFVAWYADRPAMWLPADEKTFNYIKDRFPVRALYLQDGETSKALSGYDSREKILKEFEAYFGDSVTTPRGSILYYRSQAERPSASLRSIASDKSSCRSRIAEISPFGRNDKGDLSL